MSPKEHIHDIKRPAIWVQLLILAVWLLGNGLVFAELAAVKEQPKIQLLKTSQINSIVELPDGGMIVGGSFTRIGGKEQNCIARIKADGTLDEDWDPGFKGSPPCINTMVLAGDSLYVGGGFYHVGGKYRRGICRLDVATGKVDPDWYPVEDGDNSGRLVYSMQLSAAGDTLFIGGSFAKLGKDIQAVAKVSTLTGDVDPDWDPGMAAGSQVRAMLLAGNSLYIGGGFTSIAGISRNRIAKLSAVGAGSLDMTWNPDADSTVSALLLSAAQDKLYVGGDFKNIGGVSRKGIARVDATGSGQVDSWDPQPVGHPFFIASVRTLDLLGTKLYIGGHFAEIGGMPRSNIARLSVSDASADLAWDPDINKKVKTLLLSSDGNKVHVGGEFFKTGTNNTLSLSSVDTISGSLTLGFSDLNIGESAGILALAGNGNDLYFGGDFVRINGQPQFFLGKMNTATGQVLDWGAEFNDRVMSLALSGDGATLYVGGNFTGIGGTMRNRIAKLSTADAGIDASWNPGANAWVRALLLHGNDLYVGGRFVFIGGSSAVHRLARLAADSGNLDSSWNPAVGGEVFALALSGTDLYAGGIFTTAGGLTRQRLAKIDVATGNVDPAWAANANSTVRSLLVNNNSLFVGGNFTEIGGVSRNRIAKLATTNAAVDPNWHPNAANDVHAMALSADGNNLYLGGWFNGIGGANINKIAKVAISTGSVDPQWNLSMSASGEIPALLTDAAGVYAGGNVEKMGGKTTALGHIVAGHQLTVDVTTTSTQASKGVVTSAPEGIECSVSSGLCDLALVAGDYLLTAASSSLELTISQEWLSGCDSAGGTSPNCGLTLNADKTVEVSISCEIYDLLPPDDPVTGYLSVNCKEIKANKGYAIGDGGRVVFDAQSSVELGPGFRVSSMVGYFRVRMQ